MYMSDEPASEGPEEGRSIDLEDELRALLHDALELGPRAYELGAGSPLLGALPELDSMGALAVLSAIEQRFGLTLEDDEIDAGLFQTFGSLAQFLRRRLQA